MKPWTELDKDTEQQYQQWRQNLPENLRNEEDYDLRGAFITGLEPGENAHLPDTFKLPNHPTFSNESVYSSKSTPGGQWVELEDGKWVFNASPHNVNAYGKDKLIKYFQDYEPDATLVLPGQ